MIFMWSIYYLLVSSLFIFSFLQYTFPDERSASIGTWILTLFIFFTPALQGIVDAYVFFEKKIFSHGSGMLPISGEDSELDRTDSSVMIGQQRFPVQTCNRQVKAIGLYLAVLFLSYCLAVHIG